MIRASITATLIILGACAAAKETKTAEPDIVDVRTRHKPGEPHEHWPVLQDERRQLLSR